MTGSQAQAHPLLFSSLQLRDLRLRNRVVVSPMCQYSAADGLANEWHLVHLGRFALGGAGLVIVEQTAVLPAGRITHGDLGLWQDQQIKPLARIARFLKEQGAAAGIQLGHAGRKGARARPWAGYQPLANREHDVDEAAWQLAGPTDEAAGEGWPKPNALNGQAITEIVAAYASAAARADAAGFDVLEVHAAHGYLLHSFLSPLSNHRTDGYGGSTGRMLFPIEVAQAIREA